MVREIFNEDLCVFHVSDIVEVVTALTFLRSVQFNYNATREKECLQTALRIKAMPPGHFQRIPITVVYLYHHKLKDLWLRAVNDKDTVHVKELLCIHGEL